MRGKQRKLQRCVRGSYDPLYRLSRNEHRVYSNSAWVPASDVSQPGVVDVRIEREFNRLSRKQMAEVKQAVIVVVCHVENPTLHF
jgi:hypothetical protein